jgi:hypothetical protein
MCHVSAVPRYCAHPRRQRQHVQGMTTRATQCSARVLRGGQSMLPLPPAHRGAMLSSLIWSLSTPSASLPYLKPTPGPAPSSPQVLKRGMATIQNAKHLKTEDPDDEDLARLHRTIRNESQSHIDMWSLPLDTLGASPLFESVLHLVCRCDMGNFPSGGYLWLLWNSET